MQQALLKDEQRILRILQMMYADFLRKTNDRIFGYYARLSANPADAAAVYQLRYQRALSEQLDRILEGFAEKNYTTIQSYLEDCYTNGFVGAMYDIWKQGVPVMLPIQQENAVRAITLDSQISIPLYTRMGNNIALLKTAIAAEVTRGIASGTSWHDTAAGISRQGKISAYNAMRIARTEGHRIACAAQMDACQGAAEAGADIVKQWDSTMDDRTRQHHRDLHGQVRELGEPFEAAGLKAQYPGAFGRPEEDIHCRCCLLQRARWALSEEKLKRLRERSGVKELDGAIDCRDFKEKYLQMLDKSGRDGIIKIGDRDGAALENQRYGRNKNTLVNKTYIESGEYRRKYDSATDNPAVNKILYDCAKRALKHRSGTVFEDMYWIDGDTGEVILKVTDSNIPRGIAYTDRIRNAIKNKTNIVTLHTHPSSMPPSVSDLNSCFRNQYRMGFVACHDGTVFGYSVNEPINDRIYNIYIQKLAGGGHSEYDAQRLTLIKLMDAYDFNFWEVGSNE